MGKYSISNEENSVGINIIEIRENSIVLKDMEVGVCFVLRAPPITRI